MLEDLAAKPMPLLIGGDFNLHVQDSESSDFKCLQEVLNTFGLVQRVNTVTHRVGVTLDLVITYA